jgi:hypothetical protein
MINQNRLTTVATRRLSFFVGFEHNFHPTKKEKMKTKMKICKT